jgi:CubicO group peptidase (beta-lactamase class C family)
MPAVTRRIAIKRMLSGVALCISTSDGRIFAGNSLAEEIAPPEREAMASVATDFMKEFDVPGLSLAIAHEGRMVYQEPFGVGTRRSGGNLTTSNLLRIASVTKPITSVGVFTLIEKGQIGLNDKVFGKHGILGTRYGTPPYKQYVEDITIDHLLTHTAGGWDKGNDDPMFANPEMDQPRLISWTLDNKPLSNSPGTQWAYSNFGYCVLGRVIEQITQKSYRDYIGEAVLTPCGITDMTISGNTAEQRAPDEVTYYGQNGENPYGMNIARMDSHGGWLANPADLVRFATHVDGSANTANILKLATIRQMTTNCDANTNYARGWMVNSLGNWWHNGSLPGTTAIMVRTSNGFCWAALVNTRRQPEHAINLALDDLVWDMARKVKAWKL